MIFSDQDAVISLFFLLVFFCYQFPSGHTPIGQFKDWAVWGGRQAVRKVSMILVKSLEAPPRPVPEPGIYLMLLASLGLLGFVTLRRKEMEA